MTITKLMTLRSKGADTRMFDGICQASNLVTLMRHVAPTFNASLAETSSLCSEPA